MSTHSFKPGDRVRTKAGDDVTIQGPSFMAYVVQYGNGTVRTFAADTLEPIPADPRVEVVARLVCDRMNGEGTWAQTDGPSVAFYRDDARAILAALDAHSGEQKITVEYNVSYPQPRRVRKPERVYDCEGDRWSRNTEGTYDLDDTRPGDEFRGYTLDYLRAQLSPIYVPLEVA